VYLATLRLGETPIEPISKLSHVRREDVYRALPRLYQLGIIRHLLGTPLRVTAVPLREATNILLQEKREDMESELGILADLSDLLVQNYSEDHADFVESKPPSQFEVIEGKVAMKRRNLEMAHSFRHSMSAVLSDEQLMLLIENGVFRSQGVDDNKSIRLIICPTAQSKLKEIREWRGLINGHVNVRFISGIDTFFSIYDEDLALIYLPDGDNRKISLLGNNSQFITFLNQNFNLLWGSAVPTHGN
jgi:sugar-specific transcriptional regulator TrmB